MSIGTPNGILDITGATLRVSKMEFRQSTGFDTVLNNVARNTMLLMDETEQTTSNSWALKLPNAWVAEFHGYWASGSSGAPILFNFYNDSTSGTNGYTLSMNDTTISINYDGGSTLGSATLSSTLNNDAYRKVAIIFERSVLDVSVDGEHVFHFADSQLRDRVYDNNSGYVTFTHSSTDERKLKNLKFTNGDKWVREIDSSNIAYVGGNVGIGTTIPGTKLDVSGTVRGTHLMGDGSAISAIQSSNVSDFGSNVTRIGTLETDLGDNSSRITNLSSNLSDNSSRITALESGDISISGDKTFTGDIIFESNIHMNGGNVLVANTVNMTVSDPIIELGSNNIGANDLGIIMTRPAANSNVAFVYDESDDILRMGYTLNGASDSIVDLDSNALAVSVQGALSAASVSGDGSGLTSLNASNITTGALSTTTVTIDDYLIHDGDTDTKVGFPLADTFAVNTAGSERLRVDSSGNVGIGTASPAAVLDVFSSPHVTGYREMAHFRVSNTSDDSDFTRLIFGQVTTNKMFLETTNEANTKGDLLLQPYGGNVGIGTTNPVGKLDVLDGASNGTNIQQNAFFYLRNPANAATNYGAALVFENTDGAAGNRKGLGRVAALRENNAANYSSYLQFSPTVNGSEFEAMRITSAGNVGIGTASPNGNLHIMSDLANASSQINPSAQLVLHSSLAGLDDDGDIGASLVFTQRWLDSSPNSHGTMGSIHGFKDLSAGNYGGGLLFKTQPGSDTAPVERMRIDRDGNVGIGTASPDSRLVVEVGGTNNTVRTGLILRTPDSDIGTGYNIDFHQSTTLVGRITSLTEGGGSIGMAFSTYNGSTTERMRIASNGNVGIGTASPLTNLDINGDLRCPSLEAQYTLSGGGDVTWTGTYVKWSTRVIALPVDPNYAASGHYNINCPTSGTITYYANSGDTTKTCTSSGIPLGDWDSLYYVITKGELSGSGSAPINGNFIAVQYTNTNIKPQTNWLFICGRNSDNSSLKWMPGQQNLAIGTTLSSSGGYTYKQYTLDEAAGKSLSGAANNESITIAKKGLAFVSFSALIRASATNGTAGVGTTACYASLRKNSTAVTEYIGYRWATYGYTNDTDRWRALNLTWSGPVDTGDVINFYVNTAENTIGTNGSHFSVLVI